MKNEWQTVAEALLFDYGKQVLGKNAGGMISNLLRDRGLDGARLVIKMAATKSEPREYIGAVLRQKAESDIKIGEKIGNYWWNGSRWAENEG